MGGKERERALRRFDEQLESKLVRARAAEEKLRDRRRLGDALAAAKAFGFARLRELEDRTHEESQRQLEGEREAARLLRLPRTGSTGPARELATGAGETGDGRQRTMTDRSHQLTSRSSSTMILG
ncbi:hypothetical protein [Blastococcus mobilis]|uniref:hypothetical protein n=1 Tax=Blastococcus mobilis TaxID=1938746 RepID=UPI001130EB93|nr:hypothetical protein [Blastococcus mobilis]